MAIGSADHEVTSKLILDGSPEGLVAAMQKSVATIQQGTADITGHFTGMAGRVGGSVNSLIGIFGTLGGIIAGGAAFKAIVSETVSWDLETGKLAKTLGATTQEASIFKVALHSVGIEQDVASAAALRMAKTMGSNAEAFKTIGVDIEGMQKAGRSNIEMMVATVQALNQYKGGLDRNQMAMTIFGRSWGELQSLMKLSPAVMEHAREEAERLHLVVGPEGVAKTAEYKKSLRELSLVQEAMKIQIGHELIPVLTDLGVAFGHAGVSAASGFGSGLRATLRLVAESKLAWATWIQELGTIMNGGPLGSNWLSKSGRAEIKAELDAQEAMYRYNMERIAERYGNPNRALQPTAGGKSATHGGGAGGASAALKDHFSVDSPGFLNWRRTQADEKEELAWLAERNKELDAAQAELAKILHEMELDEIENGLKKSDAYLNAVGKLSDSQQSAFDQGAMLSDWAARKQASDAAAAQSGQEFYAMLGTSGDSELQQTLMRIEQEKEARISSWVMMTDSFEVEAARRAQVEAYYAFKTAEVTRAAERQKLDWTASGFASMSSLADSFYSLSGKRSRAAFEAGKVMKIGETVFTTASAAMKAYDAMADIPYVGPALGAGAAAAAIGLGMVQIQNIESATPDGGGRLNSSGGGDYGGGYSGGSPSDRMVTQPIGQQASAAPTMNLVINNPIGEKKWFEDNLPGILKDFASRNVNTGVQYA